ncbi:ribonuclease E/G [Bacteroidota bacterium]
MNNELIIKGSSSEILIALLQDKKLVELNSEKRDVKYTVGDMYLGRVKKIMPGLNAAFIDVGYGRDAFLHYHDLGPQFRSLNRYVLNIVNRKSKQFSVSRFRLDKDINKDGVINEVLMPGQKIVVQIAKEPISTKGPRLTSEISIAGRHLVLMPFSNKVSVSSKIVSLEERNRLKRLIESIKPKNYGVIVRTVAEDKKVAVLDSELQYLVRKWERAFSRGRFNRIPQLLISELDRTAAILRDMLNPSFNHIYVDDEITYREAKNYLNRIAPEKEKIVKFYQGKIPIFEKYEIDKQIKSSFGKTVSFKQGAYLIIEHTEALHVIDVNSGNRSKSNNNQETNALEVNLAAAGEISRQLRLRDMGGIIVIDFIDMTLQENKQKLFDKMREIMSNDRTKHNILPLSKFGLMQITRQRVRPVMDIKVLEKCPSCKGSGEVAPTIIFTDELVNKIGFFIKRDNLSKIVVHVHPYVAAFINKGLISKRFRWVMKFKTGIKIISKSSLGFLEYHFYNQKGKKLITE